MSLVVLHAVNVWALYERGALRIVARSRWGADTRVAHRSLEREVIVALPTPKRYLEIILEIVLREVDAPPECGREGSAAVTMVRAAADVLKHEFVEGFTLTVTL